MAGTLAILASMGFAAVLVVDRQTAGEIMKEGALVEELQTLAFGFCGLLIAWRAVGAARRGEPVMLEILTAYFFALLVIAEQDLDIHLFGVRVMHTRFFIDSSRWLPYRVAAALVLVGGPLALGLYGLRHVAELWRAGLRVVRDPRVWLGLAATVIFGLTQVFERRLARVGDLPRNFLEEGLELIAAIWFVVAVVWPRGEERPC